MTQQLAWEKRQTHSKVEKVLCLRTQIRQTFALLHSLVGLCPPVLAPQMSKTTHWDIYLALQVGTQFAKIQVPVVPTPFPLVCHNQIPSGKVPHIAVYSP